MSPDRSFFTTAPVPVGSRTSRARTSWSTAFSTAIAAKIYGWTNNTAFRVITWEGDASPNMSRGRVLDEVLYLVTQSRISGRLQYVVDHYWFETYLICPLSA